MTDRQPTGDALDAFAARLGLPGIDVGLLANALRHRSWCAENPVEPSNERLEFLGDAVLGLVITEHLYTTYPDMPEGELAKVRAAVVSAAALARVARQLDLGEALDLGRGEASSGGREKSSILADATEAVFGAIYISGGLAPARELILRILAVPIAEAVRGPGDEDFKTRLQELAARAVERVPRYTVRSDGPDHAKEFHATVEVPLGSGGVVRGEGEGRSKKQAEQAAAQNAWQALADALATVDALDLTATSGTTGTADMLADDDEREAGGDDTATDPREDRRSHA